MSGQVIFAPQGWEDYCSWVGERKILIKISRMIKESLRDPSVGIGKPELLVANFSGYYSRRITEEDRLVYRLIDENLYIAQARGHY